MSSFFLSQKISEDNTYDYNFENNISEDDLFSKAVIFSNLYGKITGNESVDTTKLHNGFILRTPTRLFYNTFYFIPNYLNLGNVNNDFEQDILVWNAHFYPATLQTINYERNQGVVLHAPENRLFKDLELKPIKVSVKKDGSNVIAIVANVSFSNNETFKLPINGTRQLVVLYLPEKEFDEVLTYKTEISQSRRKELRAKLYSNPIRSISHKYKLVEEILAKYLSIFKNAQAKTYLTPLWQEMKYYKEITAGSREIQIDPRIRNITVGSTVVIWENENKAFITNVTDIIGGVYKLQDVVPRTYKDCLVIPTLNANILESINVNRELIGMFNSDVVYTEANSDLNAFDVNLPFLNGKPVLEKWQEDGSMSISQKVTIINDTFAKPFIHINQDKALMKVQFKGLSQGLQEYHEWLDFFNYCSGQFRTFWIPTLGNELKLIVRSEINANSIAVLEPNDFTDRCAVRIARGRGCSMQFFYAQITKAHNQNGQFMLSLDKSVPFALELNDPTLRICLMYKVRLDSDEITIKHLDYYRKEISFGTTEVL